MIFKKFNEFFCTHVNNVEVLEEGKTEYTQFPKYEHGNFEYYYVDIIKETCYKCGKIKIRYKRRYKGTIFTL